MNTAIENLCDLYTTEYNEKIKLSDISQKYNQSTLMITHDVDEAVYMSDRIYVLSAASDGSAYIKSCVEISRKRENRRGFDLTEEFLQYKKKIHDLLY